MIDPRLITFINVAKIKNFTKTAEILSLTQPAVSQQIKFLEEYYRVSLIRKKGRQIELTEEGEILFKYAKELEVLHRALEDEIRNKSGIVRRYNVGATMTIGEYVLPPILGKHKGVYKNIDIMLYVNNTEEIIKRLLDREIDIALIEGPFDKHKFNYRKLKDDELVLTVSLKHSFSKRKEVNLKEVMSGKLILRERGSGTRKVFENRLVEEGCDLNSLKVYMEIGSINAIKSLVESNLGYTVISKEAVKREVELGVIKIVPIKGMRILREFNFIYLDESPREFVNSFMHFCHMHYV